MAVAIYGSWVLPAVLSVGDFDLTPGWPGGTPILIPFQPHGIGERPRCLDLGPSCPCPTLFRAASVFGGLRCRPTSTSGHGQTTKERGAGSVCPSAHVCLVTP